MRYQASGQVVLPASGMDVYGGSLGAHHHQGMISFTLLLLALLP